MSEELKIEPCGDCDPCIGGRPDQCAISPQPPPAPATGTNSYHEFLAFSLYASKSAKGGEVPCRWETLRDDLKQHWKDEARKRVDWWISDEEEARKRRDESDPRAFFCEPPTP